MRVVESNLCVAPKNSQRYAPPWERWSDQAVIIERSQDHRNLWSLYIYMYVCMWVDMDMDVNGKPLECINIKRNEHSPSKSTVPEPSESISSIIMSSSCSVSWSSSSLRISFRQVVGMKPLPCLSYKRNASRSSFCMASASSSTMNLAASWTNSPNSKRPDSEMCQIFQVFIINCKNDWKASG